MALLLFYAIRTETGRTFRSKLGKIEHMFPLKRFQDDFISLLEGFDFESLENDPNSIYGLSVDLTLHYLNPAWFNFAKENDGEPAISERFVIGTHVGDAMRGPAKEYYLGVYHDILQTGNVWHHDYECSSPEKHRIYHQSAYPLYSRRGIIVVNSLVAEQPHDACIRKPCQAILQNYINEEGFVTQCSNCRRFRRCFQQDAWDWVPAWVEQMPENTSHSFCQLCYEYYYKFKYPRREV